MDNTGILAWHVHFGSSPLKHLREGLRELNCTQHTALGHFLPILAHATMAPGLPVHAKKCNTFHPVLTAVPGVITPICSHLLSFFLQPSKEVPVPL